jgi:hypothetical protein
MDLGLERKAAGIEKVRRVEIGMMESWLRGLEGI